MAEKTVRYNKYRNIVYLLASIRRIHMSYFVLRMKNERNVKSRVLDAILKENPTYSLKEYKEAPDPDDDTFQIISLTVYEKGPYCHIRKILRELRKNNEIECLNEPSSEGV